jgi:hypothetical protein
MENLLIFPAHLLTFFLLFIKNNRSILNITHPRPRPPASPHIAPSPWTAKKSSSQADSRTFTPATYEEILSGKGFGLEENRVAIRPSRTSAIFSQRGSWATIIRF